LGERGCAIPTISTLSVDVVANTSRLRVGLAAAATAFTALAAGAAFAFGKFEEAENVLQQTGAVIKSTGGAAHVTADQVAELSDALSTKAGVDDEVIQAGENMLLTFKNIRNEAGAQNDIFNQASVAALDLAAGYAAASGSQINLKSATIQLGKALNDPIAGMSSLTRVGVQFTEEQQKQIAQLVKHNNLMGAQKIILQEVTSQFQGSAEAQATASGKARVAFENLAETVGGVLAPAFEFLLGQLNELLGWLQEKVPAAWESFQQGVDKALQAVKPFTDTIGHVLIPLFQTAWHTIRDRLLPALDQLKPILVVIGGAVVLFATVILAQLALVVTAVTLVIDAFGEVVQFVRDKVVEPIGNFLARIADFIGKVAGEVKDRFLGAWKAVSGPVLAIIDSFIEAIQTFIGWIKDAINWLGQLGEGVSQALAEKGAAAGVFSGIGPAAPPGGFQHGGIVTRSGLAMVHRGEAFSGVGNEMGFGGVTVNVTGWVGSDAALARKIRDELNKLGSRNAGTGIR
jgi:hypothetical protein